MAKGSQKTTAHRTQPDTSKRVRKSTKTIDWRPAFLKSMAKLGNVSKACKAAKIGRSTAYEMRDKNAGFLKDWDQAMEEATDALENEARRRAERGVRQPIYQGGLLVGYKQMYSDGLMQLLLKAHRPEKYKDRASFDHTNDGGKFESGSNIYVPDNGR